MTEYSKTGKNSALSAYQFLPSDDHTHAWNLTIWEIISCGGPLDAPDLISAGSCNSSWAVQTYIERKGR